MHEANLAVAKCSITRKKRRGRIHKNRQSGRNSDFCRDRSDNAKLAIVRKRFLLREPIRRWDRLCLVFLKKRHLPRQWI